VPRSPEALRKIAPYLNIGGIFAGCLVLGVLLGRWLDVRYGTEPWLLLGGSVLGMGAGFYHFFKVVLKREDRDKPGPNP